MKRYDPVKAFTDDDHRLLRCPGALMPRRDELRAFLIEQRRRLHPERIDFPAVRSKKGLSQADVAELAGVSLNWYELFESGRDDRQVSERFVKKIAQALRLDEDDRRELFRLAVPETEAAAQIRRHIEDGTLAAMRSLRVFARKVRSATDFLDMARLVAETMRASVKPDSAAIVTLNTAEGVGGFAIGALARYASAATYRVHWEALSGLRWDRVAFAEGGPNLKDYMERPVDVAVTADGEGQDLLRAFHFTPELYSEALYQMRALSCLNLPLMEGETLRGFAGGFWTAPRSFSQLEIETVKAIAAIIQLTTEA
jgi:transcriptional regulator with XRE-family HTH domain